jgi:sodium transport system permease protein
VPRWSDVRVLYLRELRSALRERHIVVNGVLIPIFLYPVILWLAYTGIAFVSGQGQALSSRVLLRDFPAEHAKLRAQLEGARGIAITDVPDPEAALRDGRLEAVLEFLPAEGGAAALAGNFRARIRYDRSKDRSATARQRVADVVTRYREEFLAGEARRLGVPSTALQAFWIESTNVASGRQMGQFLLGLMLPLFLVIMLSLGAFYPAIDATAGEREHSTWETLMTVATSRINVVVAKYLYVATLSCGAGLLNLAAMTLTMKAILTPLLGERAAELSFQLPWTAVPVIALGTALLALFVAAGMMILASFARTFKEGQSMVSPFYLLVFLPLMFLQVPDLEFTPQLALIPVVNVAMMFRDAIAGRFAWPLIGITVAVEAAVVAAALRLAAAILTYEDFVLGSYSGSFGRFVKRRLLRRGRAGRPGGPA